MALTCILSTQQELKNMELQVAAPQINVATARDFINIKSKQTSKLQSFVKANRVSY
jgi:hypothetical protein